MVRSSRDSVPATMALMMRRNPRNDAEAADKLAQSLEAMGYNLNCESFITRGSSINTMNNNVERYAAPMAVMNNNKNKKKKKKNNNKLPPSQAPRPSRPSRYNFEGHEDSESSSSSSIEEEEDDDDDEEDSNDSSDDDSSDDDSSDDDDDEDDSSSSDDADSHDDRYADMAGNPSSKEIRKTISKMKKKEIIKRLVSEMSAAAAHHHPSKSQDESRNDNDAAAAVTPRSALKIKDSRDGPVLQIAAVDKGNQNHKKKGSGIGRMFRRKNSMKTEESLVSDFITHQRSKASSAATPASSYLSSRDAASEEDNIILVNNVTEAKSAESSKYSKASGKTGTSSNHDKSKASSSSGSKKSIASSKQQSNSTQTKSLAVNTGDNGNKAYMTSSRSGDGTMKDLASPFDKSVGSTKSKASGITIVSSNSSKLEKSGAPVLTIDSEGRHSLKHARTPSSTSKDSSSGRVQTSSQRRAALCEKGVQTLDDEVDDAGCEPDAPNRTNDEAGSENDRNNGNQQDFDTAAGSDWQPSNAEPSMNRSESSEKDRPQQTLDTVQSIEATATMMNEGALEVSLRAPAGVWANNVGARTSMDGDSHILPRVEADTPVSNMSKVLSAMKDEAKKFMITSKGTEQTETSNSECSAGPKPQQPDTNDAVIRPPAWGTAQTENVKAEEGAHNKTSHKKSAVVPQNQEGPQNKPNHNKSPVVAQNQKGKPRLTVNPKAPTATTMRKPKSTERAITMQRVPSQLNSLAAESASVHFDDEVVIEGMSVVKRQELLNDQKFEPKEDVMNVVDIAGRQRDPLYISPRPTASPRRKTRHSAPPSSNRAPSRSPSRHRSTASPYSKKAERNRNVPKPSQSSSPSKYGKQPSEQELQSAPGPSTNSEFPPEEHGNEPAPHENEIENTNKKRVKIGKLLGFGKKLFSRKEKKEAEAQDDKNATVDAIYTGPEMPVDDLTVVEGDEGLDFMVRQPKQPIQETVAEEDIAASLEQEAPTKTVAFSDNVRIAGDSVSDEGEGSETKNPSEFSVLTESEPKVPAFLEVEVDNEGNHVEESENLQKKIPSELPASTKPKSDGNSSTEPSLGHFTMNTNGSAVGPSNVSSMMVAFGDYLRSIATSAMTDEENPAMALAAKSVDPGEADNNTVDTNRLQEDYPTLCRDTAKKSKKKKKQFSSKVVSTLEGLRLAAMSPTRKVKYPTEDDISFAPSQGSIEVLPSPEARKKPAPQLKSALKSTPSNKVISAPITSPASSMRRSRTPYLPTAANSLKSPQSTKSSITMKQGNQRVNFFAEKSYPVTDSTGARVIRPKKQTQKYTAKHEPLSRSSTKSPNHGVNLSMLSPRSNLSTLSPQSTNAIANPLSPASVGGDSNISSIKDTPYYGAQSKDDATWAEVNSAANVLGRVMSQVGRGRSIDTNDEAQQLQVLLSEDSAVGDVEQALQILKRHARRLGVRESDLYLAAAKSEDTELLSVRSLSIGEEFMEIVNTYFRGRR